MSGNEGSELVDSAALNALIEYANSMRLQCDGEFCVGVHEHEDSAREFGALVGALRRVPE